MNLNKNPLDINDKELILAQFQLIQLLHSSIVQMNESFTNEIAGMKDSITELSGENKKLRKEIAKYTEVSVVKSNVVETFKHGKKSVICYDRNTVVSRYAYAIKPDGTCLAWKGGFSSEPPGDSALHSWAPGTWDHTK